MINISHSEQWHNIKHVSCIFTCINKTDFFFKIVILIPIFQHRACHPVKLLMKKLISLIFINMVLKYDIHFNRMSNYIIHSLYVVY